MPFCHATLTASKPSAIPFRCEPKTLGDHLRHWRASHNLTQAELAKCLGADETTVWNWENSRSRPAIHLLSRIIARFGYDPEVGEPESIGQRLAAFRRRQGLSLSELARRLGIDPATLARWEREQTQPRGKHLVKLEKLVGAGQ